MRTVLLARRTIRKVGKSALSQGLEYMKRRALAGSRGNGWHCELEVSRPQYDDGYNIQFVYLHFYKSKIGDPEVEYNQWVRILDMLARTAKNSKFGEYPWCICGYDDEQLPPDETEEVEKRVASISIERASYFDRLYGVDHQVEVILSALKIARETDYRKRFNCLLYGPTACGKSEALKCIGNMLGSENSEYLIFNGTALTQAGVQRILLEATVVPPVLMIEEIEKCDEANLRWLLDVLDHRGEIRKTNFRGNFQRSVKMLCIATVNNVNLFNKRLEGALGSRFAHQIQFPRPSQEILRRILKRELADINGDEAWIEPTIQWAADYDVTDTRRIIAVCLCGQEKLLTGEYQEMLESVSPHNHDFYKEVSSEIL